MRAIILAAGRGSRMGQLTDHTPKALLKVKNKFLIEYSIESLKTAGIHEIVINISYKREQIKTTLGDGSRFGVCLQYSEEPTALETGGGIFQALPLLGNEPFITTSCDIISDYAFQNLKNLKNLAHLILVNNPSFHPKGDFCLENNRIYLGDDKNYTYGNIGLLHPALFSNCKPGRFLLGDLLKKAIAEKKVSGECFQGRWSNIGTKEDLAQANLA